MLVASAPIQARCLDEFFVLYLVTSVDKCGVNQAWRRLSMSRMQLDGISVALA